MNRFLKTTLLALMAIGLSSPAWAALELTYGTGVTPGDPIALTGSSTCKDGDACDQAAAAGTVTIQTTIGTLTINSASTTSQSPFGNISFTLDGSPTATGAFYFLMSDIDFTSPAPPVHLRATVGGTNLDSTQGNLTAEGWVDGGNTLYGTTDGSSGQASTTIGAAQGVSTGGPFGVSSPYSMTLLVGIDLTNVGGNFQVNGNLRAVPVPEPGSMFLLGGALLVTGKFVRRKLAKA